SLPRDPGGSAPPGSTATAHVRSALGDRGGQFFAPAARAPAAPAHLSHRAGSGSGADPGSSGAQPAGNAGWRRRGGEDAASPGGGYSGERRVSRRDRLGGTRAAGGRHAGPANGSSGTGHSR